MDKKLQKAYCDQIKNELYSAYLYLGMAAYFEARNLSGFAHWMKVQFKEETAHAMKMFDFLNDRGVKVVLQAIAQPTVEYSSCQDAFETTLAHEKKVTSLINGLVEISRKVEDNASLAFLQWFVSEQVEEEKNATMILETLKMLRGESAAVIMLDRELARRGE